MIRVVEAFSSELPSWLTGDKQVVKGLNNRGIDLANATYVLDAPPNSGRDKKMNDLNRLPVYRLFDMGGELKVFIPGLTDPEVYYNGNYTRASKLSGKGLLSRTFSYGYIDLTDSKNMKTGKQAARKAAINSNIKSKTEGRLNDPQQWRHAALVNNDDNYFIVGSTGGKRFNDAQADEYWDIESSSHLFTDGQKTIRIGGFYVPNADESYTVIRDNDGRYSEIMHNARWIPEDHRKYPTYFFD